MVKALIASVLFILSVQIGAQTSPYYMDHETFVHLSAPEQKKILVGMMSFMVEMERMYPKQVLKADFQSQRKIFVEKFVLHMNTLQGLMLASAHAQEDKDPDPFYEYRLKFEEGLTKATNPNGKKNICIYGGWISTTINNICMHPSKSSISSYHIGPNTPKLGPERIACNPLIFGFKDPEKKILFSAVATSSSVNSSLDCMKQSQADPNKEARINQLKNAYLSNSFKASYNKMTKFIHQTCLCSGPANNMDTVNLSRIQPHRTCFSLLNQYRVLRENNCSSNLMDLGLNVDNVQQIFENRISAMQKSLDEIVIKDQNKLTEGEKKTLKDLDSGFKNLLGDPENQKKFCIAQEAGNLKCKILSCSDGKDAPSCKVEIEGTDSNKFHTVTMTNGTAVVKKIRPLQSLTPQDVTCTYTAPTCAVGACKEGKCPVTISGGKVAETADESITFGTETSKSIKVIPDGLEKSSLTVSCKAPPKDPVCEVSKCVTDEAGVKTCDFTVPGFETKQKEMKFTLKDNITEIDIELADGKSVKCSGKDDEKKSSCSITFNAVKDDPKKVDAKVILTIADGDEVISPPTFSLSPAAPLTASEDKLSYSGQFEVSALKDKKFQVSKFSKKFKEEVCEESYPKDGADKLTIALTKDSGKKDAVTNVLIFIVTAKISKDHDTEKDKLVWKGGEELTDGSKDKHQVKQTSEEQEICVEHEKVEVDGGTATCIKIDGQSKATLDLKGINRSNQTFDVTATVTDNGKVMTDVLSGGLTLVWFEKNRPELTVEEKAARDKKAADKKEADEKIAKKDKTKTPKGGALDSNSEKKPEDDKNTEKKVTAKDVDGQVQSGPGLTYSSAITTAKYDICANLMRAGKVEATQCKTVPGYIPPVQQQMGPPQVPGAYRYRRW